MTLRSGRVLLVGAVTFAIILTTALFAGTPGSLVPRVSAASPQTYFSQTGRISPSVAAKALNALNKSHAKKGLTNAYFILNWVPNVEFAGLWVAQQKGWWQKAGIQMTFEPWSNAVNPERDVPSRGGNTFGFQSGAAIAIAVSKGEPDEALYTDTQNSVFGLTVLKSSHITKLSQLKGKKIGYQPHELYVPETMMSSVGLKKDRDWTGVPVGFNIVQLTAGRVDAYEVFVTNEPIALKLQGVATKTFPAKDYRFHSYDDVLFTYRGLINKNPSLVRKVVSNVARGYQWAHTHVAPTVKLTTDTYFKAPKGPKAVLNVKQQTLELKAFAPYSKDLTGRYRGLMNTAQWAANINTLKKYGLIKTKPNPATIYTNQFNPYR